MKTSFGSDNMTNIHYFYDPMCGWCYGATALIQAIEENPSMKIIFHPGGMIEKRSISEQFKQHIMNADPRIAALTGVEFGESYISRLRDSEHFIVDSYLPIKAILIAESLGVSSFRALKAIQHAHYVQGVEVYKLEELQNIMSQFDIDITVWLELMVADSSHTLLEDNISHCHSLMQTLSVSGYPTLIAEHEGSLVKLPHEQYYGRLNEWKNLLTTI